MPIPNDSAFIPVNSRWSLSRLEQYEARCRGEPEPPSRGADEVFLDARTVAARYNVSLPTIWRWAAKAKAHQKQTRAKTKTETP